MNKILLMTLKSNPKMYEYLKENSELIKYLNRNSLAYKEYETFIKEKYKLRMTDKISSAIDNMDLVINVLNTLK